MSNTEKTVTALAAMAMSRGGTWAAAPGAAPRRKRYAVKRGHVVRRRAFAPIGAGDVLDNARMIEITRDGAELVIVSYA